MTHFKLDPRKVLYFTSNLNDLLYLHLYSRASFEPLSYFALLPCIFLSFHFRLTFSDMPLP